MNPVLIQAGIAGPLVFSLIVYMALRPKQTPVHRLLAILLSLILCWMVGMVMEYSEDPTVKAWGLHLLTPAACGMSPIFFLMMARYARIEAFERSSAPMLATLAPFVFFYGAFLTDPWHGLMIRDPNLDAFGPDFAQHVGPLFWAFQVWSNAVAIAGLGICFRLCLKGGWTDERRRAVLLIFSAMLPLAAHLGFITGLIPLGYPLTPAALAVTSLLVVMAIQRYRLLEVLPVARRDVIEASSEAVILADAAGVVVDFNPAAATLLDFSGSPLRGIPIEEALAPLESEELTHLLGEVRARGKSIRSMTELPDGRILEINAGSPRDSAGRSAGTFVAMQDRTAERRAERQLQQSQKLESVGILAAGVAHEVNNPLAFVRANLSHLRHFVELARDNVEAFPNTKPDELADLEEVIDDSLTGLDRIAQIVEGMLRFARVPSREWVPLEVNDIVQEAVRFAQLEKTQQARFETDLEADLPPVRGVSSPLVQVLLNLFLNAKRVVHDKEDGRITARTRHVEGAIEIHIEDNGPGVPEALRSRIFDPFFTTRAPSEGTGLGLSIAFDIVRDLDGILELCSGHGEGACFCVRLPCEPPEPRVV